MTLSDAYGEVRFYLLPFIKPANVRRFYPNAVIESYTDALRCAVEHMDIDPSARNVLVTHQFVTGGVRSESEDITVGGTDNVDAVRIPEQGAHLFGIPPDDVFDDPGYVIEASFVIVLHIGPAATALSPVRHSEPVPAAGRTNTAAPYRARCPRRDPEASRGHEPGREASSCGPTSAYRH